MAGYTAANNLLGFIYMSVNAVTQACMSFTSQNYGARKPKAYGSYPPWTVWCYQSELLWRLVVSCIFGRPKILAIYNKDPEVIHAGMEVSFIYHIDVLPVWSDGSVSGALRGMGRSGIPMLLSIIGTVGIRVLWIFAIFLHTEV